jgi:hypothetical protein
MIWRYRIKNKASLTPYTLTDPLNVSLRQQLLDAVDIMQNAGDFIPANNSYADGDAAEREEDLPDDYAGSASDSDFDPEEYKRERERMKREERSQMNGAPAGMI